MSDSVVPPPVLTPLSIWRGSAEEEGHVQTYEVPFEEGMSVLDALRWMDSKTIAALVENEHPQIAALVLANLEAPMAADVLQLLPGDMQPDVIYRVARLETVTAEALEELERILVGEVHRVASSPSPVRGGTTEAALNVFAQEQLAERFIKAVEAASRRGAEMGRELGKKT